LCQRGAWFFSSSKIEVKTTEVDGKIVRGDGLPNNPLYFGFVREGTYDKNKSSAAKYGDGRVIKRTFDDCKESSGDDSSSDEKKKAKKKVAKKAAKKKVAKKTAKKKTTKKKAAAKKKRR